MKEQLMQFVASLKQDSYITINGVRFTLVLSRLSHTHPIADFGLIITQRPSKTLDSDPVAYFVGKQWVIASDMEESIEKFIKPFIDKERAERKARMAYRSELLHGRLSEQYID